MEIASGSNKRISADLYNVLILACIWIVLAFINNPTGNFPLNDDWVYALSVKAIVDIGRFELHAWSQSMGFVQAYWAAAFVYVLGFDFWVLRLSTLLAGLGGIVATYALMRNLKVESRISLLGATAVAVNPVYYSLSNTFMTDVPFYFLAVTSVIMLMRELQGDGVKWLVGGVVFSCAAILNRQLGFVIPLGFAAAYVWAQPNKSIKGVLIALLPFAVGALAYQALQLWLSVNGRADIGVAPTLQSTLSKIIWNPLDFAGDVAARGLSLLQYVGLSILPVSGFVFLKASLGEEHRERRKLIVRVVLMVFLLSVIFFFTSVRMPSGGNVLAYWGIGPLTLRDTFLLNQNFPPHPMWLYHAWTAATVLSFLGMLVLLERLWAFVETSFKKLKRRERSPAVATAVMLGVILLGYSALIIVATESFFDRYILFCVPIALVLVTTQMQFEKHIRSFRIALYSGWLVVVAAGLFSVVATRDYLEWNSKRWEALRWLMEEQRVEPTAIDGGYEFNAWYLNKAGSPRGREGKSWWWVEDDEYIVASGPVDGYQEIATFPFRRWLQQIDGRVVVLKRVGEELP